MARSFSPTRALGIAPQDFNSYWQPPQDEVGRPDIDFYSEPDYMQTGTGMPITSQYGVTSGRPFFFTPSDPIRGQEIEQATGRRLAALQAQAEMGSPEFNPFSEEGRQKRASYLLQGALSPQLESGLERAESMQDRQKEAEFRDTYRQQALEERQRQHDLQEQYRRDALQQRQEAMNKPKALGRYSPVDPKIVSAASALDDIDPHEPNAWTNMQKTLTDLSQDPELKDTNWRSHPYFDTSLKNLKKEIMSERLHQSTLAGKNPDLAQIEKATKDGIDWDLMRPYLDEETGERIKDRAGFNALRAQFSKNKMIMNPRRQKMLDSLQQEMEDAETREVPPTIIDNKIRAGGGDPSAVTAEERNLIKAQIQAAPRMRYEQFMSRLRKEGYRDLNAAQKGVEEPEIETAASGKENQPNLVVVRTLAEYNALPPGTNYVDRNGKAGYKR